MSANQRSLPNCDTVPPQLLGTTGRHSVNRRRILTRYWGFPAPNADQAEMTIFFLTSVRYGVSHWSTLDAGSWSTHFAGSHAKSHRSGSVEAASVDYVRLETTHVKQRFATFISSVTRLYKPLMRIAAGSFGKCLGTGLL